MNLPIFDLHCDTATELLGRDFSCTTPLRSNKLHIDLERMKQYPAYAQCFAFWFTTDLPLPKGIKVEDLFWRELSVLQDQIDKNKDLIRQARSAADVRKNMADGVVSAIFTLEGPAGIGFDPAKLQKLHNLGFRISTLGWNENNCLTGSQKTGGGLTKRGREYVKECQRLGILVDVSHISDEAFWQIIDMTDAPVIATHSNSRAVCSASRNLTDDMFRAVCSTGGVAGLTCVLTLWASIQPWILPVTTFFISLSWILRAHTLLLAVIWTVFLKCRKVFTVFRIMESWHSVCWNAELTKIH